MDGPQPQPTEMDEQKSCTPSWEEALGIGWVQRWWVTPDAPPESASRDLVVRSTSPSPPGQAFSLGSGIGYQGLWNLGLKL